MDYFLLPFKGLRLVFNPGYRKYVAIPLVVNIVLLLALLWLAGAGFEAWVQRLLPETEWLSLLRPVAWALFALAYLLAVFFGFTALANLIGAPFNGPLAARIEQDLTGERPGGSGRSIAGETLTAVLSELDKLLYFVVRALPLLILFVIPVLSLLASVLWFLLGAWWLALEYLDYPLGNHGLAAKSQRALMREHRLACLSFGAGASLLLLLPVVNLAAMPATVAGATLLAVKLRAREQQRVAAA